MTLLNAVLVIIWNNTFGYTEGGNIKRKGPDLSSRNFPRFNVEFAPPFEEANKCATAFSQKVQIIGMTKEQLLLKPTAVNT